MKRREGRAFKPGVPHHIYTRAKDSFVLFYTVEDFLLYFTIYSVMAKRYGISTLAFCIMFNHTHELVKAPDREHMTMFKKVTDSEFTREYNSWRGDSAGRFSTTFGSAPKIVGKMIRACIIYIFNNPVAGKLKPKAADYKWNLLAYYGNKNPFSTPVAAKEMSRGLRRAIKLTDYYHDSGKWLSYNCMRLIFEGLSKDDKARVVDHIISIYNFMDYEAASTYFGGYDNMCMAIDSSSGSEHDIPEDWEDYSEYVKMLNNGSGGQYDFHRLPLEELIQLEVELRRKTRAPEKQIWKFLHLKREKIKSDTMH